MTWVKLDDKVASHAKTIAAGNAAFGAWIRMIAWSCSHLTDGVVSTAVSRTMASPAELKRLVEVGLLDRSEAGYAIHDFLDWNPSAAEVMAKLEELSEKRREAGRRGGQKSGETRRRKQEGSADEASAKQVASGLHSVGLKQNEPRSDPEGRSPCSPPAGDQPNRPAASPEPRPNPDPWDLAGGAAEPASGPDVSPAGGQVGSSAESPALAPKRPSRAERAARMSPCPASDAAAAELEAFAARWKLDPKHPEFPQFLDHHAKNGGRFVDWAAAWRTWMRNAAKWGRVAPAAAASTDDELAIARSHRTSAPKPPMRLDDPPDVPPRRPIASATSNPTPRETGS